MSKIEHKHSIFTLKMIAPTSLVLVIMIIFMQCSKDETIDKKNPREKIVTLASIISGTWKAELTISKRNPDLTWTDIDRGTVDYFYGIYSYWNIDTNQYSVVKSSVCDFQKYTTFSWSTVSDKSKELMIGSTLYKIIEYDSIHFVIQGLVKEDERYTYKMSTMDDYSLPDYRDPWSGLYYGYKRSWYQYGAEIRYEVDSTVTVSVAKISCSSNLIRLDSLQVYALNSNLEFSYRPIAMGSTSGKFSNDSILEITYSWPGSGGYYFYGIRK